MTILSEASPTALLASLVAGTAVIYAAFRLFPRKKKYRCVGQVEEVWIYPVKSCKGVSVTEAECTQVGLKYKGFLDRHWAISTTSGAFITQRMEPTMALIEPSFKGSCMELNAPGMESITFEAFPEPNETNRSKITVWGTVAQSVDVGDEVGKWMSTYLKRQGVRMHFSAPSLEKRDCYDVKKTMLYPAKRGDVCAFPDLTSYMILSHKSIDFLNTKLENSVNVRNFRPNILVDGCGAFAEDSWSHVNIGSAALRALVHCTRCVLTTVNPAKGEKDKTGEPLATLKKFRIKKGDDKSPCFGMHHVLDEAGTIKVGDEVFAIDG